jgi:hypothetical protein
MKSPNFDKIARKAVLGFKGNLKFLEGAIGSMYMCEQYGWKVFYLVHDKKTIKRYEEILGINFRDCMPEIGPHAEHSVAFQALKKVSNFWKAVKGEIKGVRSPKTN